MTYEYVRKPGGLGYYAGSVSNLVEKIQHVEDLMAELESAIRLTDDEEMKEELLLARSYVVRRRNDVSNCIAQALSHGAQTYRCREADVGDVMDEAEEHLLEALAMVEEAEAGAEVIEEEEEPVEVVTYYEPLPPPTPGFFDVYGWPLVALSIIAFGGGAIYLFTRRKDEEED